MPSGPCVGHVNKEKDIKEYHKKQKIALQLAAHENREDFLLAAQELGIKALGLP